jgi:hypothetical protein
MLLERFNEPLGGPPRRAPAAVPAPSRQGAAPPRRDQGPAPAPARLPAPPKKSALPFGGLALGLAGTALLPASFLFFLWWQDAAPRDTGPVEELSVTGPPAETAPPAAFDVALSAPGRLEADAGQRVSFPIAIDATAALPARSVIAVSDLPQGTSFSQGRPNGPAGWSLRPDEIAGLQLSVPAQIGAADIRLELVSGDGTVLAQSATQLSIMPPPVATVDAVETALPEPMAQAAPIVQAGPSPDMVAAKTETTGSVTEPAPAPQRKPPSPATAAPEVKVNTVKVVTVKPPRETRPHDGAYALGTAADEPAEWMETKTAVDMHAKAQQSSETVKVAEGGVKMRVVARDKRWIQVTDPATSTTGWIYDRFLQPADAE